MKHITPPIRALLLAAGLGTRLRPITNHTPKCLVEISGKPLLGIWLDQLNCINCEATLINTHYLSEQVRSFASKWESKNMFLKLVHEETLQGTAQTLKNNSDFFRSSTNLLIHADNVSGADLGALLLAHDQRPKDCLLTMLTFSTDTPSSCGIVQTDERGVLTGFHEKVAQPPGNCANGAVYVFDPPFLEFMDMLPIEARDFSTDVIPNLIGKIQTFHTHQPYIDIGTEEMLNKARRIWGEAK